MKFTCPVCQTVYRIDDERFIKPVARSICRTCGSELSLNQKTGVVVATRKSAHDAPAAELIEDVGPAQQVFDTPFAAPGRPVQSGDRDYLALGLLATVIAAFIVAVIYLAGGAVRSFVAKPVKVEPVPREAVARQNHPKTRAPARTTAGNGPVNHTDARIRMGYKLYKNKHFDKALQAFGKAVKLDPENASAYFWRGRTYIQKEQYADASKDFLTAVKLNPGYSEAYDNLGWLAMQRGALDESLRYLNRSIQLKPGNGWAYYNRGHIYFKSGKQKLALKDAQKACGLGYKAACQVYARYKDRG